MIILSVLDKNGKLIYLSNERWKHIINEHPIISNRIAEITETITNPLIVKETKFDPNKKRFYRFYKNIKLKEKYLLVVIKYLNGNGFIITSFFVRKIKDD